MARKRDTTVRSLVRSRAELAGIEGVSELARKTGIPRSTLYQRLDQGGWMLSELRQIHRAVGFEPEDLKVLMEGKQR